MKRASVKPPNGIADGEAENLSRPEKSDKNILTCSNGVFSPSKSGDMQANGYLCIAPDVKGGT